MLIGCDQGVLGGCDLQVEVRLIFIYKGWRIRAVHGKVGNTMYFNPEKPTSDKADPTYQIVSTKVDLHLQQQYVSLLTCFKLFWGYLRITTVRYLSIWCHFHGYPPRFPPPTMATRTRVMHGTWLRRPWMMWFTWLEKSCFNAGNCGFAPIWEISQRPKFSWAVLVEWFFFGLSVMS